MCHEAGQSAFLHTRLYLYTILIISYLATFPGTNSLSVLMWNKTVNQSINQLTCLIIGSISTILGTNSLISADDAVKQQTNFGCMFPVRVDSWHDHLSPICLSLDIDFIFGSFEQFGHSIATKSIQFNSIQCNSIDNSYSGPNKTSLQLVRPTTSLHHSVKHDIYMTWLFKFGYFISWVYLLI